MRCASMAVALAALGTAPAARADGGTLQGRVEATPARYLADTVVYLKSVAGTYPPRTHVMDQEKMRFVPRILTVTQGDSVRFENHDNVAHNVYSPDGEAYNLGSFQAREERSHLFAATGVYTQLCGVHPEMLGFVFVGQNPYASVVDAQGRYAIRNVPPGTYRVAVWNAHLKGEEREVTIRAGAQVDQALKVQR